MRSQANASAPMEAGALVGAVTPELIAAKIAQGRREIGAAFAAEDFELARFLVRRNAGYRLFFAPRVLRRRPPPQLLGLAEPCTKSVTPPRPATSLRSRRADPPPPGEGDGG